MVNGIAGMDAQLSTIILAVVLLSIAPLLVMPASAAEHANIYCQNKGDTVFFWSGNGTIVQTDGSDLIRCVAWIEDATSNSAEVRLYNPQGQIVQSYTDPDCQYYSSPQCSMDFRHYEFIDRDGMWKMQFTLFGQETQTVVAYINVGPPSSPEEAAVCFEEGAIDYRQATDTVVTNGIHPIECRGLSNSTTLDVEIYNPLGQKVLPTDGLGNFMNIIYASGCDVDKQHNTKTCYTITIFKPRLSSPDNFHGTWQVKFHYGSETVVGYVIIPGVDTTATAYCAFD